MSSHGELRRLSENSTYLLLSESNGGFRYNIFTTTAEPHTIMWYVFSFPANGALVSSFRERQLEKVDRKDWVEYAKIADADHHRVMLAFDEDVTRAERDEHIRLERDDENHAYFIAMYLVLKRLQKSGVALVDHDLNRLFDNFRISAEDKLLGRIRTRARAMRARGLALPDDGQREDADIARIRRRFTGRSVGTGGQGEGATRQPSPSDTRYRSYSVRPDDSGSFLGGERGGRRPSNRQAQPDYYYASRGQNGYGAVSDRL